MFGKVRQLAIVALGAGAVLTMGMVPANAASSQGAAVQKTSNCYDYGYAESCYTNHSVSKTVHTPSGNTVRVYNGKHESSYDSDYGYSSSSEGSSRNQSLIKDGKVHQSHGRYSSEYSSPYSTCTYESASHYANGEYQFSDYDRTCR